MPTAVITMDAFVSQQADFIKFKDKSQKTWNCNKEDLIPHFTPGERYFIDYNETEPKNGYKYGSKYINRARFWKEEDGANTWPDKEPYKGSNGNGGNNVGKEYNEETSKRQTAANCTAALLSGIDGLDLATIATEFEPTAVMILGFLDGPVGAASGSGSGSDEDFGFGS